MQQFTINNIAFVLHTCPTCNVFFAITDAHDDRLRDCGNTFYCPSGHSQSYKDSLAKKLERAVQERDEAKKIVAMRLEKATQLEAELARTQRQIKRLKAAKK